MIIEAFILVQSSYNLDQSDDNAVYQSILTGMMLYDAMTFSMLDSFNAPPTSGIDQGMVKALYKDGVRNYHNNKMTNGNADLYLWVNNNPKKAPLSWRVMTPKDEELRGKVIEKYLPSPSMTVLADNHYAYTYQYHVSQDTIDFITDFYGTFNNKAKAVIWPLGTDCGLYKMKGWTYKNIDEKFLSSIKGFGFIEKFTSWKGIWISEVTEPQSNPWEFPPVSQSRRILEYFPKSLADVSKIISAIYSPESPIVTSLTTSAKAIERVKKNCYDVLSSQIIDQTSSLRDDTNLIDLHPPMHVSSIEDGEGFFDHYFVNRDGLLVNLRKYFNTFLYGDLKQSQRSSIEYSNSSNRKNTTLKEDMKMNGMFGNLMEKYKSMIVPVTDPNLKITMDGNVAVRNGEGEYVSINAENEIVTYPADFTISVPIYVIKKPFASIQPGEILKKDRSYVKVLGRNADGSLKCLSFTGYTTNKKPVTDFMLGASYVDVIVNIMNIQSAGINPMMLALMNMSGEGGTKDNKEMLMLMAMSGGMGQMNPMMLMMLMGDKGGDSSKLMETMMMMSMFGGMNQQPMNGGMGMFGGMNNMFGNMGNMFGGGANPFTSMFNTAANAKAPSTVTEDPESPTGEK